MADWKRFSSISSVNQTVMDITGEWGTFEPDRGGYLFENQDGYIIGGLTVFNTLLVGCGEKNFDIMQLKDKDMIDIEREFTEHAERMIAAKPKKPVLYRPELAEKEIDELAVTCASMYGKLANNPHSTHEERDFWLNLQSKLILTKVRTK